VMTWVAQQQVIPVEKVCGIHFAIQGMHSRHALRFPPHHCRLSKSGHRNQVKPALNGLADSGSAATWN
jgi:hypothetical protein